jgi:hypothetical protein
MTKCGDGDGGSWNLTATETEGPRKGRSPHALVNNFERVPSERLVIWMK